MPLAWAKGWQRGQHFSHINARCLGWEGYPLSRDSFSPHKRHLKVKCKLRQRDDRNGFFKDVLQELKSGRSVFPKVLGWHNSVSKLQFILPQ